MKYFSLSIFRVFVLFFFSVGNLFAQQNKIDSLLNLLKKDKDDTTKVIHLNELSLEYRNISSYDSSIALANAALKHSEQLNPSYKKGIAASNLNIGRGYYEQGNYTKTLEYCFKALQMSEEIADKSEINKCLITIGIVYDEQAEYSKALDYYLKALKVGEELGNKRSIAVCLDNIGIVYDEQKNYLKAFDYDFKALKMAEELADKNLIAMNLGNIGVIYDEKAVALPSSLFNVGQDSLFKKALDYYFKALKMTKELGDKEGIARHLGNIGSLYINIKKYAEAEKYLLQALAIDTTIGTLTGTMYRQLALSNLYEQMGNATKALKYYKKAITSKDSLFSQEEKKQLVRKEMNYEFDKKEAAAKVEQEKKDTIAEEEKRRQKIITYSVSGGLFLVLLLALFIFRGYRQKQKANIIITQQKEEVERQKQIIEIKNQETEVQKRLVEAKNKNITDSINYAKRIQESFLLSEEEINKMLPYKSFVFFQPKDIVSGDFYWFSPVKENGNTLYVAVAADCTGHGVPGAFLSMMGNMLLNEIIIEKHITDPALILKEIHHGIFNSLHRENEFNYSIDGMDVSICVINPAAKIIRYAGAMNPIYIIRQENESNKSKLEIIKANILSLGGKAHDNNTASVISFTNHTIVVEKGMCVYLFSDGYMDQFSPKYKLRFGSTQFKQLLVTSSHLPIIEQKSKLKKAFDDWMENGKQIDDVLVMGIQF